MREQGEVLKNIPDSAFRRGDVDALDRIKQSVLADGDASGIGRC
jgi:hypothetical protein